MATSARLQEFYIAYYGRPADVTGLDYWLGVSGSEANLVTNFGSAQQTEFTNLYGTSPSTSTFVNAVYQNLFGHDADTGGLQYWIGVFNDKLQAGKTADSIRADMVMWILDGAQSADAAIIAAKKTAAVAWTAALDGAAEIAAYDNVANVEGQTVAREWLADVVSSATATSQVASSVLNAAINSVVAADPGNAGETQRLTIGTDNLVGTARNDVFVGNASTLEDGDAVVGGVGRDSLNLTLATGDTITSFEASSVETINVTQLGDFVLNAANISGVDTFVSKSTSAQTLDINNIAESAGFGFNNAADSTIDGAFSANAFGSDAATLNVSMTSSEGVLKVAVAGSDEIDVLALTVTGENTLTALTSARAATVTVEGDGNLTLTNALATSVDAGDQSGSLTFTLANAGKVLAGSGADAITGSSGVDTITVGAGNDTVSSGGGADIVAGGLGSDVLKLSASHGDSVFAYNSSVETVVLGGAESTLSDSAAAAGTESVYMGGTARKVTVGDGFDGDTLTLNLNGVDDSVSFADSTTSVTLTIVADTIDGDANVSGSAASTDVIRTTGTSADVVIDLDQVSKVESIVITDGAADSVAASEATITLDGTNYDSTQTVTITANLDAQATVSGSVVGADTVNVTDGDSFDGKLNYTGGNQINLITGGSQADTITTGTGADVIDVQAGADVVNSGSGADTITGAADDSVGGVFNGGEGNDVFKELVAADVVNGGGGIDAVVLADGGKDTVLAASTSIEAIYLAGNATITSAAADAGVTDIYTAASKKVVLAATTSGDTLTLNLNGVDDSVSFADSTTSVTLTIVADTIDGDANVSGSAASTDVIRTTGTSADVVIDLDQVSKVESIVITDGAADSVAASEATITLDGTNYDSTQTVTITANLDAQATVSGSVVGADTVNVTDGDSFDGKLNYTGGNQINLITGGSQADTITTGTGADSLAGGAGNDVITSGAGADSIWGGTGNDVITSGTGADIINAGAGYDTVNAGDDNDIINVTAASDFVLTAALEYVDGGAGTDALSFNVSGGVSATALNFGGVSNVEWFDFSAGSNEDTVTSLSGANIKLDEDYANFSANTSGVTLWLDGASTVVGSANDDVVYIAKDMSIDSIVGAGAGTDTLYIVNNLITSGYDLSAGSDTLSDSISVTVGGAHGFENITVQDLGADSVKGVALTLLDDGSNSTGSIAINFSALDTNEAATIHIADSVGSISIETGSGADRITVEAANAESFITGAGADSVYAGAGNDTITTGIGADVIYAGAGNDIISSGLGADTISLVGGGTDTIDLTAGGDDSADVIILDSVSAYQTLVISGFEDSVDELNFASYGGGSGEDTVGQIANISSTISSERPSVTYSVTDGVLTISTSGATYDDYITVANEAAKVANEGSSNGYDAVAFAYGSDTYVLIASDTVTGAAGYDQVIKLVGVSDVVDLATISNLT